MATARAETLNAWVSTTLTNRADQSWSPAYFVSSDMGGEDGLLPGETITVDAAMPLGTLEIRNSATGEPTARNSGAR